MKHLNLSAFLLVLLAFSLSGCDLAGDILEFGFWTAIIIIAIIVLIVVGIYRALKR